MEGIVREKLNIYYLLDTSASMYGTKIQQLNTCMQDLKWVLEGEGVSNNVEILIRVIEFGNDVKFTTGSMASGVPIEKLTWVNLNADGKYTPTAQAINLVGQCLNPEFLGRRALRPVVILVTDGMCNDNKMNYDAECKKLAGKIGGNATRIAIAVDGADKEELKKFATHGRFGEKDNVPYVFSARDADTMTKIIHWASVVSIGSSIKHNTGENTAEISIPSEATESGWI